ncbi:hypothetical protein BDQ17DRAFT_165644 [Cyathus striatus]|nr:hypothetical protein BDQ17DRAFT_165644 [Cyathus striatus]
MSRLPGLNTGGSVPPQAVSQTSYTIPNIPGSTTTMTTDANGNIIVTITNPLFAPTPATSPPASAPPTISPAAAPPPAPVAASTKPSTNVTTKPTPAPISTDTKPTTDLTAKSENFTNTLRAKIANRADDIARGIKRSNSHLEAPPPPVKRAIIEPTVKNETPMIDLVSPIRSTVPRTPRKRTTSYANTSASSSTVPRTPRKRTTSYASTSASSSTVRVKPPPCSRPPPITLPCTLPTINPRDIAPPSPTSTGSRPTVPPPIYGMDKQTMFEYIDPISCTVWKPHLQKEHFWVMIGDDKASNSNGPTQFKIEFVVDTLHSAVGAHVNFVAIPASTVVPRGASMTFKAPHPILVTCDDAEVIKALVAKRYIDTKCGWLTIFSKDIHPSSFIMYLRAPGTTATPEHKAQVIESVRARLRSLPEFKAFVEKECTDSRLSKIPESLLFEYIVNSVRASPMEVVSDGFPMTLWRIYMHPITEDVKKHWAVLVFELRKLKYAGPSWIAEPMRDPSLFRCNRCKGLDHPAGLCPVAEYEGSWCRAKTKSGRKL